MTVVRDAGGSDELGVVVTVTMPPDVGSRGPSSVPVVATVWSVVPRWVDWGRGAEVDDFGATFVSVGSDIVVDRDSTPEVDAEAVATFRGATPTSRPAL